MAQYGIQWDSSALSGAGKIQWIQMLPPSKFLIKQGEQYYSIKPEFYVDGNFTPLTLSGGINPNSDDYNNFGFENIGILTNSMTVGEENFKPIDKLNDIFTIKMCKFNE
jgi:hypothetical protein